VMTRADAKGGTIISSVEFTHSMRVPLGAVKVLCSSGLPCGSEIRKTANGVESG